MAAVGVGAAPVSARAATTERLPDYAPDSPGRPGLAIGVTEFNANLVWPQGWRTPAEGFSFWRDQLAAMHPRYFRLVINWRQLQPSPDRPADLDAWQSGCVRNIPPCVGWRGLREMLAALAAAQRFGGWETLAVITETPDWAASDAHGCEREGTEPRSRPPRSDALAAYRELVARVLAAAREEGADLRWWSAWNEPNHPFFLSPQRAACDPESPTLAVAPYLRLVRALDETLDAAPGRQSRVLGEVAASINGSRFTTSMSEFIAALPRDVVCASRVWSMHPYVPRSPATNAVAAANRALHARGCVRRHAIWATETGLGTAAAGNPDVGLPVQDRPGSCQRLHAWLYRWYRHPTATVVFQYTFREDPLFPVGLVNTSMSRGYSTLRAWIAWGSRRLPDGPPPTEEEACGTSTGEE